MIGTRGVDLNDRFVTFLNNLPAGQFTNAREVLERFADADTRRFKWRKGMHGVLKWLLLLPAGTAVGAILKKPYGTTHWVIWAITALMLIPGIWIAFFTEAPSEHFSRKDLE